MVRRPTFSSPSFRRKPESSPNDLIIDTGDVADPEMRTNSPDVVAEINRLDPGFRRDDRDAPVARVPGSPDKLFNDAIDRRRFLNVAGCAAVLVAAGEWIGGRLDARMGAPLDVTLADGLARGEARAVLATDGREALTVKLADGALVAFDRRCPHLGCPVLWSAERVRFECPCHHAAFDARTGAVLFGPPRRGLTRALVRQA